LKLIADLRTERIITKTEYLRKRQRILELLWCGYCAYSLFHTSRCQ
jgi:hypothetical protein